MEQTRSSWQIELQCPQCGAPVSLEEADRLLSCSYCRARLYLWTSGQYCYYLPALKASSENLIFIPYWRFRGSAFSVVPYEIQHRILDTTLSAYVHRMLPMTLGIRPQVLPLRFASHEVRGTFVKPQISLKEAVARIQSQFEEVEGVLFNNPPFHREFIGEFGSLIFSPVFLREGTLFDGILGRSIGLVQDSAFGEQPSGLPDNWQITPIPALCPGCGNGLHGGRESLILLCTVCHQAYRPSASGWVATAFEVVSERRGAFEYLPFWRIRVAVRGLKLASYADLARLANIPKMVRPEWEDQEFYFWVPAFKVPPSLFLRLSKQMTLFQPAEKTEASFPEAPLHPATFSEKGATTSLKIHLAHVLAKKKDYFPRWHEIEIAPVESTLVFVPFTPSGRDLVHPQIGISLQKQTLSLNN